MNMDVISLSKANKTLNKIKQLDESVVAPLAEDRFPTVDARLDWLEGQASKVKAENSKQLDLSQGVFNNTELVNGKITLKKISENPGGYSGNIIPAMTDYLSPSGIVTYSSVAYGWAPAWKAFDGNPDTQWVASGKTNNWIAYEFPVPQVITKYALEVKSNFDGAPGSWNFEAWDNSSSQWIVLDSQSFTQASWQSQNRKEFTINNNTAYKKYRLYIHTNANNLMAANTVLGSFEMMTTGIIKKYVSSGTWETPIIDLGEGWKETKLVDVVKNIINGTKTNLIPVMTSNTTPSGIASASSYVANSEPWKAFDNEPGSNYWWQGSSNNSPNEWLAYEFPTNQIVNAYSIKKIQGAVGGTPTEWTFEGWDGSSWIILDEQTLSDSDWDTSPIYEFNINNNVAYKKYRINIKKYVAMSAWPPRIAQLSMYYQQQLTDILLEVSTSNDGTSFTPYAPLDSSHPPQGRYIKIRATLSAQAQPEEVKTLDFNQSSSENMMTLNEYTEANGKLQLKNAYTYDMTDDGALGAGKQFSVTINKANFKSIESIGVN
jgi:hypothetical protein